MRQAGIVASFLCAGLLCAQQGQQGPRPGWPCVAGRAVDPAYVDISESTGGQLFLFQKGEVGQSAIVMSAPYSHPATLMRAVGTMAGTRDFEFLVDSSVESLLLMASLQCRNAILLSRPNGAELTAANSARSIDLQAGRIVQVDNPEPGRWRVRMTGTGLFVLSVLAKSGIGLGSVSFHENRDSPKLLNPRFGLPASLQIHLAGPVTQLRVQLVDAAGNALSEPLAVEADGWSTVTPSAERFRVRVSGIEPGAWPFLRTWPVLFHAAR
jgi:hypothetical protein